MDRKPIYLVLTTYLLSSCASLNQPDIYDYLKQTTDSEIIKCERLKFDVMEQKGKVLITRRSYTVLDRGRKVCRQAASNFEAQAGKTAAGWNTFSSVEDPYSGKIRNLATAQNELASCIEAITNRLSIGDHDSELIRNVAGFVYAEYDESVKDDSICVSVFRKN